MLDINTPRGRKAAQLQAEALSIVTDACGVRFVTTSDIDSAFIDAMAINADNEVQAVAEVKSRDMTEAQLKRFGNEWLLTYEKILHGALIAKYLRVPFIGVLYLIPDAKVMTIVIADKDGELIAPIRINRTETQKTINGGKIIRTNAYLNMDSARIYEQNR